MVNLPYAVYAREAAKLLILRARTGHSLNAPALSTGLRVFELMRSLGLVLVKARLTASAFSECPRVGGCAVQDEGQARWEFRCSRPPTGAQHS